MNYEETRFELFIKSYVGMRLISSLRIKYKIYPGMKPGAWYDRIVGRKKRMLMDFYIKILGRDKRPLFAKPLRYQILFEAADKAASPEITKLAKELEMNEQNLRAFILFNYRYPVVLKQEITRVVTTGSPLTEEGIYIKVTKNTKEKDIKEAFDELQQGFIWQEKLFEFMGINKQKQTLKKQRTQVAPDDDEKKEIFLKIEKEMKKLYGEKKSNYIEEKDYQRELVGAAIERVAGNLLKNIDDEEEFERRTKEMAKTFETWYYAIAKRYQLPTPKKLSSILRVISS